MRAGATDQDYKTYLVSRVEDALAAGNAPPSVQQRMFGGVAFMMNGNMLCCASNKGLMVRVGAVGEEEALSRPHAQHCLPAGRPMTGFILVDPDGVADEDDLSEWLALARRYVESLPPKKPKTKTPKKKHHKPTRR